MAADRAPFVAIRTDIRKDERVSVIADVAGYNRHEAMGRLLDMWAWCSDRKLEDAPDDCDGYALSDAVLRRFLGPRGVEAILGDGCDELALGVRRPDGLVYLRGTSDTVARLRGYRRTAVAGGEARVGAPRDEGGHFVSQTTVVQLRGQPDTSSSPAAHQQSSSSSPAVTSEYPRSQIPDPRSQRERESGAPSAAPVPLPRKRSSGTRDPKPPVPGHQETIACFTEAYERAYSTKPTWSGRRAKQVQELLRAHGESEVRRRIGILFGGGLAWPAGPYDFDTLVKHFDKLAQPAARAGPGNGHRTGPTLLQSLLTDIEILERDELEKARQCE
jgi:hypothetical protein